MWIPNLNYSLYSRCCPLLYLSQPTGSISSCLQLTLTEVTHLMDPRSGSLVTLGHAAQNSNTHDVISNRISDSHNYQCTNGGISETWLIWVPSEIRQGSKFIIQVIHFNADLYTQEPPCFLLKVAEFPKLALILGILLSLLI